MAGFKGKVSKRLQEKMNSNKAQEMNCIKNWNPFPWDDREWRVKCECEECKKERKEMRNIIETIDKMINILPDLREESELIKDLDSLKTSCVYSSPEMMTYRWGQLARIVNEWMPKPENLNEWQKRFVEIFTGKEL